MAGHFQERVRSLLAEDGEDYQDRRPRMANGMASSDPFSFGRYRRLGLICIEGSETLKIDSAVVVKDDSFHGCTVTPSCCFHRVRRLLRRLTSSAH